MTVKEWLKHKTIIFAAVWGVKLPGYEKPLMEKRLQKDSQLHPQTEDDQRYDDERSVANAAPSIS